MLYENNGDGDWVAWELESRAIHLDDTYLKIFYFGSDFKLSPAAYWLVCKDPVDSVYF